jgi:hypothetical protein
MTRPLTIRVALPLAVFSTLEMGVLADAKGI